MVLQRVAVVVVAGRMVTITIVNNTSSILMLPLRHLTAMKAQRMEEAIP
jgi:hypothetical protein